MDKFMKKIQPKHYGIISALLAMLGMYLILSYCQVLSTGKFIVMDADLIEQYVPFIKMFIRDVLKGESIWFSWSSSMGMNTSMLNAYYVMSPFNLLYLIFWNVDENIITAAIIILKIGLSAYTFHVFLYRVVKCQGVKSILFSIMYALSTYATLYGLLYNSWLEAVYMLPLICTFIYELDGSVKSYMKLIISYAFMFCTQFYFAYMVGIFSFVFWLMLLIARGDKSVKSILKKIICYGGSVVLAVGLAAVVVLPAFLFLITNDIEDVSTFSDWTTQFFDVYYAMYFGNRMPIYNDFPAIYCGWLTLLFVPMYFLNSEIKIKEKICSGIILLVLMLTVLISPLYQFMHAFDAPDGYKFRHAFLLVFVFCAVAGRQSLYFEKMKKIQWLSIIGFHVLAYFIMEWTLGSDMNLPVVRILMNIIIPIVWFGVWIYTKKKPDDKKTWAILSVVVLLLEVCFNGWFGLYIPGARLQENYECWKEGIVGAVEEINQDESLYRAYYNADYITNSDAWFDYNGISDFCSVENYELRNTLRELGLYTTQRRTELFGITQPVEMLLGVKYIMQGPYPYSEYGGTNIYYIEENPYYLGIGFMTDKDIVEYKGESLVAFENINELVSALSGEEITCFEKAVGPVMAECDQAEIYIDETQTIIEYNPEQDDYGMITYFIEAENVEKTTYVQFVKDYSSAEALSPYLLSGMENVVFQNGLLSVSYIKPMLQNEDRYEVSIVMNDSTDYAWQYQKAAFYEYDEESLIRAHEVLSQSQLNVEEYADGYIKGNVTVNEDKTILFTSIPYDEGWSVWVDGTQIEPMAVVGNAFLAMELEPGYHELEFEYEAPGVKEGIVISCISAGLYLLLVVFFVTRNRSKKNKESAEV